MAVIVGFDEDGKPTFRSYLTGLSIPNSEKKKAVVLDEMMANRLKVLRKELKLKSSGVKIGSKDKVPLYWKLGEVLREIFEKSNLITESEKPLYWINARIHAEEAVPELLVKDRGPNRKHLAYCFRLAGYPKDLALKMKWSEWVFLFDTPKINMEPRFDLWFKEKVENEADFLARGNLRLFIKILNCMFKNLDLEDFDESSLFGAYQAAWDISKNVVAEGHNTKPFRHELLKLIDEEIFEVGRLMDGVITPNQYAEKILNGITS